MDAKMLGNQKNGFRAEEIGKSAGTFRLVPVLRRVVKDSLPGLPAAKPFGRDEGRH